MGAVLTPAYVGLENALDLPQASTLCGACSVVCPVKIPLPDLMRTLREQQVERGLRPRGERLGISLWAWLARRPRLYALATRLAVRIMRLHADRNGMIYWMPFASGWTGSGKAGEGRFLPAPAGKTFRELYSKRSAKS